MKKIVAILFLTFFLLPIEIKALEQELSSLKQELQRLNVDTVLIAPSQGIDDYPLWSKDGNTLAINIMGEWHIIDLQHLELIEATWRDNLKLGVLNSPNSASIVEESKILSWKSHNISNPRSYKSQNGIHFELKQDGLSTVFTITPKGKESKVIWTSGFENCHSIVPSPDEKYISFICEMNGVLVYKVPYEKEITSLKLQAEQGDIDAQFNLALMYINGEGVIQDYKQAMYWFIKAAEQGDAASQYNSGFGYANGYGVTQDKKRAAYWYMKAAEQEHADAQLNLAMMYINGEGVVQDYKQAIHWYVKAAEQEDADAQFNLAMMYFNGEGVVQDYKQAIHWYGKAAEQGHAFAQSNLGAMYKKGPDDLQDYKRAIYWYTKAAEQGDTLAQIGLGDMYSKGEGVPKDYEMAYAWFSLAVSQGNEDAKLYRKTISLLMTESQVEVGKKLSRELNEKIID